MRMRWHEDREDFEAHVEGLCKVARGLGAELVVFPEDVGLLLALVDDYAAIADAETLADGISRIQRKYLGEIEETQAAGHGWLVPAFFRLKARWVRQEYVQIFSSLATKYGMVVVAGSTPLSGTAQGDAAVYNTSLTFSASGEVLAEQRKVHLIPLESEEGLQLAGGSPEDYRVAVTQVGIIGTGVCADCFDAELIGRLVDQGMEVLCDPKANPKFFTREEQEENRLSSYSRCQEFPIYAVQAFGVGNLLDIPFRGRSGIYAPAELTPDGSGVLAQARSDDGEELVTASLDMEALAKLRRQREKGAKP